MPIRPYWNQVQPAANSEIWRFMDLRKFRDLMANQELYFRRADLFSDESEGLPPETYAMRVLGLNPYDINDQFTLHNHLGFTAQAREAFYVTCWYLYKEGLESLDMWEAYGQDGVAICTRYELLHDALNQLLDDVHLGRVQYGSDHLTDRFNGMEFIFTKQLKYVSECEVRALITSYDPLGSGNRHFDLDNLPHPRPLPMNPRSPWVPDSKRRRINLQSLVTDVIISPWAEPDAVEEIGLWVRNRGFAFSARKSDLTHSATPNLAEWKKQKHLFSKLPQGSVASEVTEATRSELDQFTKEISTLPLERLRWLYKQRWEILRLPPGDIPRLSDAQYLEAILRILYDWKKRGTSVAQALDNCRTASRY